MDRNCFGRLCILLRERGGLEDGKYVFVEEQVAMFLSVLSHHKKKNRIVRFEFWRSGQTVSHYVHAVFKAVIMLHELFLAKPVPVDAQCHDSRWKWFPVQSLISTHVLYIFSILQLKNTCLMWHVGLFGRFGRDIY